MDGLPKAALVVVAYGHAATLPATLQALQALDYPADQRQIIVVENGDGSSAAVAREQRGVAVVEPGQNLGFAGGCNLGVALSTAQVVVLVNPDTIPEPTFLRSLVTALAKPRVGIVGAKLLYPDHTTLQHAGGFLEQPLALAHHYGYGEADQGQFDTRREVEFVTGAALAIGRGTWEQLGGFDTAFFPGYFEEVDLCWRVRAMGLTVQYEPSAVAIHQEAAGLGKWSAPYHRFYHRNRLRLLWKHRTDDWLAAEWLPAELAYLRSLADDVEINSLTDVYISWQRAFITGSDPAQQPQTAATAPPRPHLSELEWTLQQVRAKPIITPIPFRSRLPFVARLRTWLNRIATEDYLRPLVQQQNDFNASVVELAAALARQRRVADAAILCQGMFLAKLMRQ